MHPALLETSGWRYTGRMRDLLAARWWGSPSPGAFDGLPKRERVEVVALYELHWRMDAVNQWEAARRARQRAKRGK